MTSSPSPAPLEAALAAYDDHPMEQGDAVLLLDDTVCLEIAGLADAWDPRLRRNVAEVVGRNARTLVLAVARPHGRLLPSDHALYADLREELLSAQVELRGLRGVRAA